MNDFNNYFYIYKDSQNKWCEAKNPVFIASHTHCRAIEKSELLLKFHSINTLINGLNDYWDDEKCESFVSDTILNEIR